MQNSKEPAKETASWGPYKSCSHRRGFTLIEVIMASTILLIAYVTTETSIRNLGWCIGVATGSVVMATLLWCTRCLFWFWGQQKEKEIREFNAGISGIYQVVQLPDDSQISELSAGATISIGDYGWKSESRDEEELVYLHGLTDSWGVAWCCGFKPEQIRYVCSKPRSQYYLPISWIKDQSNAPLCPFPIKCQGGGEYDFPIRRGELNEGLQHHLVYWRQFRRNRKR
ncbi:prepilin-type N-terminal cleavage/methylation domain-containing protein [Schlesneria sp. DSM 10557]|uniref:prepilin-type N-terminal cleavage/methylation domain-containing protein n=1 Tax=Schlesneria sp. DSM 10557 TaxID=3044399 RepID=UPI00359F5D1D